jgi:hypothetical protein
MSNVAVRSARENKTHISYAIAILKKNSCRLWDNVGKYANPEATDDNMAHAHFMLDT